MQKNKVYLNLLKMKEAVDKQTYVVHKIDVKIITQEQTK